MESFNNTTYGLITIFVAICTYIVWFYKRAFSYWKKRGLEYLEPTVPFGNAYNLAMRKCSFGEIFAQWYFQLKERGVKHGGAYYLWRPVYIPIDPQIIKRVLITDFEHFVNRGLYINEKDDPISGHIFNMLNAEWKTLRTKLPAIFTSSKMRKMFDISERISEQFIKNLDDCSSKGRPVNVKNEAVRLTTDQAVACLLGMEAKTLHNENDDILKQGRSFFDTHFNIYAITAVLTIPHDLIRKLKIRVVTKELENYFRNLCQNVMDYRLTEETKRGDMADTLIKLTKENVEESDVTGKNLRKPLTLNQLSAHSTAFLAAGFETSSSTIAFAIYELAKNPEHQVKLREEIKRVLCKHDNKVTYDAVAEMKYLEQVVDETLRMYSVFPVVPRICVKDYKVPGTDITIEKDTFVMVTNVGIHRDPEYYPNPDIFDPERFSPENKGSRPFVAYIPFGEGPRICIGKRLGLVLAKLGVLSVIRNYEVTLNEKTTNKIKFEPDQIFLRKTGDIWINLKKLT